MSNTNNNNNYLGNSFFAGGQVVPDLLTEQEAIRFLRLDVDGPKDPSATLKHYRDKGWSKPETCQKYYLKSSDENEKKVVRILDELAGESILKSGFIGK